MKNTTDNIEKNVFDAIESGEAKMRSRSYFVLRDALVITGGVILLLFLVYCMSFIVFALHTNGAWFAPDFGLSGWYLLFRSLPWLLILVSIIFVALLALLARHYAFVYHRPLLYFLLLLVVIIAIGSIFLDATAFHPAVIYYADRDNLQFIRGFYDWEESPASAVHHGQITIFEGNGFILQDVMDGMTSTVVVLSTSSYGIGDYVVVLGDRNASGTIYPIGVEKVGQ